jgi:polysaccharide biosynthesis transport protein
MTHGDEHALPSLSSYLRVLRRRKWVIVVCMLVVPITTYFYSARQPAQYQSSAQVYLSSQDLAGALTGISSAYVDQARLADTAASLAHVPAVARDAIASARVKGITEAGLLGSTSIVPQTGTDILTFTVTNQQPALAERLANAYAKAFTRYRGQLDSDAVRLARKELNDRLHALEASGETRSPLATSLRDKDQQLATLEALQTSRTYVISSAEGAAKVSPQPRRDAMIGLFLGAVLGIGLALLLEALDTRVRSVAEVGEHLKIPQIGVVSPPPKKLLKRDQLVMMAQPRDARAEEYRVLRTNLEFASLAGNEIKTVLITSAVEEEGKSTVAANLAIAFARSGKRACLVDLDLRRPYLDRFFHLARAKGITDVALGNVTLDEALIEFDLVTGEGRPAAPEATDAMTAGDRGRLDVLVSGPLPPDPGEFVATQRLADILTALRNRYDMVILDSPPLLRVGDAMTLSARADGMIVLTRLTSVRRPMLRELGRIIESAPTTKLGYVVTGARGGGAYSGGYGYGYGKGGYGYAESMYVRGQDGRNGRAETMSQNGGVESAREEETV